MLSLSSAKHYMKLSSSNKNASEQVLCYENQNIENQPVTHYDRKAMDGAVALM